MDNIHMDKETRKAKVANLIQDLNIKNQAFLPILGVFKPNFATAKKVLPLKAIITRVLGQGLYNSSLASLKMISRHPVEITFCSGEKEM
jgi:hypothetical protein